MAGTSLPLGVRLDWLRSRRAVTVMAALASFLFGVLAAFVLPS
jgi:hypothetical protein